MILSTHALFGALVAETVPNHPILAFSLGFISHFALDTIPHWDYRLHSLDQDPNDPMEKDMHRVKGVGIDALKIGLDFSLGIILPLILFQNIGSAGSLALVAGALGGMAPDALQFVYMKWRVKPLILLQQFHQFVHAKKRLNGQYILGPILQILFIAVSFSLFTLVIR